MTPSEDKTPSEDLDALAAEYVLGTLDAAEREQVAIRRAIDSDLDRAVRYWEERLGPLAETVPDLAPPRDLFEEIEKQIGAPEPVASLDLRRSLRRWRIAAAAATALAASLALALGIDQYAKPRPGAYVALLQKGGSVGFLLTLDPVSRTLAVRGVGATLQPDKSYQLWLVAPAAGPRSYGLVNAAGASVKPLGGSLETAERATWAISLEPQGGSPTGKPTGPVVFEGRLAPIRS